jgi:hypothetical protein
MIRMLGGAVVLAAVLMVSGCDGDEPTASGPAASAPVSAAADNSAAVCARWKQAQGPFMSNTAPEAQAYSDMVADSYEGRETPGALEIERAYWSGWANAIRPLAAEATAPGLRAALTAQVSYLDARAAAGNADVTQPFAPAPQACAAPVS